MRQTDRSFDALQRVLTSGVEVASAIDNPQNYFTAQKLKQESTDLNALLDKTSLATRTLETTRNGLDSLNNLVTKTSQLAKEAQVALEKNPKDVGDVILADDPILYYRLNDTIGDNIIDNYASTGLPLSGRFQGGYSFEAGELHFGTDNQSISLDGTSGYVDIPNSQLMNRNLAGYNERSVEVTFQADSVSGRQMIFDAGGNGNDVGFSIYLDDEELYFAVNDPASHGLLSIPSGVRINKDETYHIGFTYDFNAGRATGFVNGEAVGSVSITSELRRHGTTAAGAAINGGIFHDGVTVGDGQFFEGRLSDIAIYNTALIESDYRERYEAAKLDVAAAYKDDINNVLSQFDGIVGDSSYRGVNLLGGDKFRLFFDEGQKTSITFDGADFSKKSLGLDNINLQVRGNANSYVARVSSALEELRDYSASLASNTSILETRQDFIRDKIDARLAGSNDLTLADQTEVGAELLALSTRQSIQVTTLSLVSNLRTAASLI